MYFYIADLFQSCHVHYHLSISDYIMLIVIINNYFLLFWCFSHFLYFCVFFFPAVFFTLIFQIYLNYFYHAAF